MALLGFVKDETLSYKLGAAKSDRLKQAKAEAEKEIKAYKQQREEAYQKRISDVSPRGEWRRFLLASPLLMATSAY